MKSWPWRMIFGSIGGLLILVGVTPIAYLRWFGTAHNFEPLSAPLSLKRGEYTSALFKTDLDEDYQVEIYSLPYHRSPLDLDWKIVDERGVLIQSGVYTEDQHLGGNDAILTRKYRPKRGSANRIILNLHQDVQAKSAERQLQPTDVRLHIGVPERGLEQGYGSVAAIVWAAVVGGLGAIILVLLLVMGAIIFREGLDQVQLPNEIRCDSGTINLGNSLTVSPTALTFTYSQGDATPPPAATVGAGGMRGVQGLPGRS